MNNEAPIGVFDSGYGGLTVLSELQKAMPENDFIYLGDNARAPYGTRSFDVVYEYTLQAVKTLFDQGCHLVILACNTASAKALRNIQQNDLQHLGPNKRVLGVIRPCTEIIDEFSTTKHVGILGTSGTVKSTHYPILMEQIKNCVSDSIRVIAQGEIVANKLVDYLNRHPEMAEKCSKNGLTKYYTTENPDSFEEKASLFLEEEIVANNIEMKSL